MTSQSHVEADVVSVQLHGITHRLSNRRIRIILTKYAELQKAAVLADWLLVAKIEIEIRVEP